MGCANLVPAEQRQLAQLLERQIDLRTWHRVHNLHVEVSRERIVVHGCAASYHVKQLALQGVIEVLGSAEPDRTSLDIEVRRGRTAVIA